MQTGRFCPGSVFCAHPGGIAAGIFYQVIFQGAFVFWRLSKDQGPVIFSKLMAGQLLVQCFGGGRRPGEYQDAGYRLIQPVDQGEIGRLSGGALSGQMIFQKAYHVG